MRVGEKRTPHSEHIQTNGLFVEPPKATGVNVGMKGVYRLFYSCGI
jgi:hypothetical protein